MDDLEKYNFGDLVQKFIPKYLEDVTLVGNAALASLSGDLSQNRKDIELYPRSYTSALYYSLALTTP